MKIINIKHLVLLLPFIILGCYEDMDDNPISDTEIKDFIWSGLNTWYYWQDQVTDLADDRFLDTANYTQFLNSFDTPDQMFYSLLSDQDRFSWIVDDYFALNNALNGVSKSNGMEFGVGLIDGGSNAFGVVQYILPNTSASTNNLQRGDFF